MKKIIAWWERLDPDMGRMLHNLSWGTAARLLSLAAGLAISVILARGLGAEKFGQYQYALSIISALAILGTMGLDKIFVRDLLQRQRPAGEILGEAAALRGVGGSLIVLICGGIAFWGSLPAEEGVLLCIFALSHLVTPFQVSALYAESSQDLSPVAKAQFWRTIVGLAGRALTVFFFPDNLNFIALWLLLDGIALTVLLRHYIKRRLSLPALHKPKIAAVLGTFRRGWARSLAGAASHVHAYLDIILLGFWLNKATIGNYALGVQIIAFCGFVPMMLLDVLFPKVVLAYKKNEQAYHAILIAFFRLSTISSIVMISIITLCSKGIIPIVYGEEYESLVTLLPFLAFRFLFMSFDMVRAAAIYTEDLFRWALIPMGCGIIINGLLSWMFIPIYGVWGTVFASLFSYGIATFFVDIIHSKMRKKVWLAFYGMATFYKFRPSDLTNPRLVQE